MEIIIEIKQFSPGRMAPHAFIESIYGVPTKGWFYHQKLTFRLRNKVNGRKILKSIENRCTLCALRLGLIGKHAHRKGNIRHVGNWSNVIASNYSCFFRSKIQKSHWISVPTVRLFFLMGIDGPIA